MHTGRNRSPLRFDYDADSPDRINGDAKAEASRQKVPIRSANGTLQSKRFSEIQARLINACPHSHRKGRLQTHNGVKMIDYAYPCMMAEKALKSLHEAMLSNAHDRATEHGLQAIAETNICLNAINGMKGKSVEHNPAADAAPDMVNSPPHYKDGGVETIDYIEAKGLSYNLGNVVKYVSRAGKKIGGNDKLSVLESTIQDLEKAKWYLSREIDIAKAVRLNQIEEE
jgi:hypothetical protein